MWKSLSLVLFFFSTVFFFSVQSVQAASSFTCISLLNSNPPRCKSSISTAQSSPNSTISCGGETCCKDGYTLEIRGSTAMCLGYCQNFQCYVNGQIVTKNLKADPPMGGGGGDVCLKADQQCHYCKADLTDATTDYSYGDCSLTNLPTSGKCADICDDTKMPIGTISTGTLCISTSNTCVQCQSNGQWKNATGGMSACQTAARSTPKVQVSPTPVPPGPEGQCGKCTDADLARADSATASECRANPGRCAPLGGKCSKAGYCGGALVAPTCPYQNTPQGCAGMGIRPDYPPGKCINTPGKQKDGQACTYGTQCCVGSTGCGTCDIPNRNRCCQGFVTNAQGICSCPVVTPTQAAPLKTQDLPTCTQINRDIEAPKKGQQVKFTCKASSNTDRYEFRYRIQAAGSASTNNGNQHYGTDSQNGSTNWTPLEPEIASSNVSKPLTINRSGKYQVVCRPCKGNVCADWQ